MGKKGWYTIREFSKILEGINALLWGGPTLILILVCGLGITVYCRLPQLRLLSRALRAFWQQLRGKDASGSYRALCTALAATVGTGNIAGVAGAIAIGGPGAMFWMWVSAFLGMATKYAESTLAIAHRQRAGDGSWFGGPMYMMRRGLPRSLGFLAPAYCCFGLMAAVGVGNATQVNAVVCALAAAGEAYGFALSPATGIAVGLVIGAVVVRMVSGGAEQIGAAAQTLVPIAAGAYILVCLGALWLRRQALPGAFVSIIQGAFSPSAVTGGAVGSLAQTLRIGISRGVFTNEAGMGTAAMAHAGADVAHPAQQGLMGIMEVFLDTIVICTLTALVILTGGVPIPYGQEAGAELTARALGAGFGPWVAAFLCACLCLFALATILGWGLYAGRCAEFLLGKMNWRVFAWIQGLFVVWGTAAEQGLIWTVSELMNGLMAIPNLICLVILLPQLRQLTLEYIRSENRGGSRAAGGTTYENFHQCKPL